MKPETFSKAPSDVLEVFLQPGEFYFGDGRTRIRTLLGSCVAITLWNARHHIGGMCHYMLPTRTRMRAHPALDGRYGDEAIQMFLREMRRTKTPAREYQVKLFGGAHMFRPSRRSGGHVDVSRQNIDCARTLMAEHGFSIAAEDLGGAGHRNVILDLWSGNVWLRKVEAATLPAPARGK